MSNNDVVKEMLEGMGSAISGFVIGIVYSKILPIMIESLKNFANVDTLNLFQILVISIIALLPLLFLLETILENLNRGMPFTIGFIIGGILIKDLSTIFIGFLTLAIYVIIQYQKWKHTIRL